jgi:hypothetical protein
MVCCVYVTIEVVRAISDARGRLQNAARDTEGQCEGMKFCNTVGL